MSEPSATPRPYAGNVDSRTAWRRLAEDPQAVLIDVRTCAEWSYVGVPELGELGKRVRFVEWQHFPGLELNRHFLDEITAAGVGPQQSLYLICRSGARSGQAAQALTVAGYTRCFNVADGFEGPPDAGGHRGTIAGWKAAGLPWRQG